MREERDIMDMVNLELANSNLVMPITHNMDMANLELANSNLVMPIMPDDAGSLISEESQLIEDLNINCENHARAAACLNILETRQTNDYVPLGTVD